MNSLEDLKEEFDLRIYNVETYKDYSDPKVIKTRRKINRDCKAFILVVNGLLCVCMIGTILTWVARTGIVNHFDYRTICEPVQNFTNYLLGITLLGLLSFLSSCLTFTSYPKLYLLIFLFINSVLVGLNASFLLILSGKKMKNALGTCEGINHGLFFRGLIIESLFQLGANIFLIYYTSWLFMRMNTEKHYTLKKN